MGGTSTYARLVLLRFDFGAGSGIELEIEIGERDCIGELGLGRKSGERSLRGGGADGPYMRRERSDTLRIDATRTLGD